MAACKGVVAMKRTRDERSDLFPETLPGAELVSHSFVVDGVRDSYGHPRVEARIIGLWSHDGWVVGWFAKVDKAVDEWHPRDPSRYRSYSHYPWYRLDRIPCADRFACAAGQAARGVKIVLAQMREYAADERSSAAIEELSDRIESQAQAWFME